jgi:HSP20 family protein
MFFSPVRAHRAALNGYGYVPSAWARANAFDQVMHDRVFVDAFEGASQHSHIESDEQSITLSLDVPGLSKDQLTIGIEGRVVRIASKDDAPRSVKATYKLGSDVDASQSQAKLENGVLKLKFAKVAPESRQTFLTIE